MSDFFNEEMSKNYDARNSKLSDISNCMHFLIRLSLQGLPARSRILCVGVGTGAEIFSLAKAFPEWSFVGVDPSLSMLKVCESRLTEAGLMGRCELIHGYVQDVPQGESFDAALSILVAHFVPREERLPFFQNMQSRLRPGGYLINTELSFDLGSEALPSMLEKWGQVQLLMGGTPESVAALPMQLREVLSVLPPSETEEIIRQSGIPIPLRFFQAMMIVGWCGQRA